MKATSFLNMVTLLTATAKSDNEIDAKLAKFILLYNKPVAELQTIFSNLNQLDLCPDDYFDNQDNTLHFDDDCFILVCEKNTFNFKRPENINELITTISSTDVPFNLEFNESIIKDLDLNPAFKELLNLYESE